LTGRTIQLTNLLTNTRQHANRRMKKTAVCIAMHGMMAKSCTAWIDWCKVQLETHSFVEHTVAANTTLTEHLSMAKSHTLHPLHWYIQGPCTTSKTRYAAWQRLQCGKLPIPLAWGLLRVMRTVPMMVVNAAWTNLGN